MENRWEEMQMKLERHSKIVELIGKYEIRNGRRSWLEKTDTGWL